MSFPAGTRFLKAPSPPAAQATDEIRRRVEAMLEDIEQRRHRRRAPLVAGARRLGSGELRGHGGGLRARRGALDDQAAGSHRVRPGTGPRLRAGAARDADRSGGRDRCPGVVLGHRHIPVGVGRRVRARRPVPDARLVVHDDRRGQGGRRPARRRLRAAPARGRDPPGDALRDVDLGRRRGRLARRRAGRWPRWPSG